MPRRGSQRSPAIGLAALDGLSTDQLAERLAGPPDEAARWLRVAANAGAVEAQTAFGQILLDGRGIAQDRAAAVRWFTIAADSGHAPAINMLGRCCELGWGREIDLQRAAECYRRAAEAGLDWGQYNLANMLLRSRGVDLDRKAALAFYQRAAEQGHAKSMNMVGRFMEEGWEMQPDAVAAARWYHRAAEGGDFRGQYNLASVLALGGDLVRAEAWLQRAMQSATADFLRLMSARLADSPEPILRKVAAAAASLAATRSPSHARS